MVFNWFQIYTEVDVIFLIQLHSLLKSCTGLQPGPQTQRRPHVSWLKRGERPDYNGRERSRSACKERRPKGKKHVRLRDRLQYKASTTVVSHFMNLWCPRRSREELEHRRAEERARQQAEAQRLIEEKRRREEDELRRAEEERAQAMREAALLQKQVGNANININIPPVHEWDCRRNHICTDMHSLGFLFLIYF